MLHSHGCNSGLLKDTFNLLDNERLVILYHPGKVLTMSTSRNEEVWRCSIESATREGFYACLGKKFKYVLSVFGAGTYRITAPNIKLADSDSMNPFRSGLFEVPIEAQNKDNNTNAYVHELAVKNPKIKFNSAHFSLDQFSTLEHAFKTLRKDDRFKGKNYTIFVFACRSGVDDGLKGEIMNNLLLPEYIDPDDLMLPMDIPYDESVKSKYTTAFKDEDIAKVQDAIDEAEAEITKYDNSPPMGGGSVQQTYIKIKDQYTELKKLE